MEAARGISVEGGDWLPSEVSYLMGSVQVLVAGCRPTALMVVD